MDERRPGPRSVDGPVWAGRLALLFIFVALAVQAVAPMLLQRRLAPVRQQAAAADEARTLVSRIQFSLASQMAALRGALLAADTANPRLYVEAAALERSTYPALDTLTAVLSDSAALRLGRLRALSARWHIRVDEEAVLRRRAGAAGALRGSGQRLYDSVLVQARSLDASIADAAAGRRDEIRRAERREDVVAGVMSLSALLASALLGWIAHRMRGLAHEAAAREEEAERALAEARRLSASRERLLRGVTHDLKNPLGAADGYTQLLAEGVEEEPGPGQKRMLERIRGCHATALELIGELLDLSQAESGTLRVSRRPADIREIARTAASEFEGRARAAGHTFAVRTPEAPLACVTDRGRVLRIVGNLLSNAAKYTPPPGRIVLEACDGDAAGPAGAWVALRVRDTGPGIPAEEREGIFDEFHRLHDGGTAGHGLGLATSRRIARLLGGNVTVDDAPGGGAVFTLWLPAPEAARREEG
jgi:signal transduction histidine kinase